MQSPEHLLIQVGQQIEETAARLTPIDALVWVADPVGAPAACGKPTYGRMVILSRQGQLFEVVGTLELPGRLAPACTAGNSSPISMLTIVMTVKSSTKVKAAAR